MCRDIQRLLEVQMGEVNRQTYSRFQQAMFAGDAGTMRDLVDARCFTANLPGTGVLTFDDFLVEVARQRTAFPDMGNDVTTHTVVNDVNSLAVHYTSNVHHTGPLTNWIGNVVEPTNRPISMVCVDVVHFDTEGRIIRILVMSDRMTNVEQLIR